LCPRPFPGAKSWPRAVNCASDRNNPQRRRCRLLWHAAGNKHRGRGHGCYGK
jgi:hypothetical protein